MNEEHSNSSSSPLHFCCLPSYSIHDILYNNQPASVSGTNFQPNASNALVECQRQYPAPTANDLNSSHEEDDNQSCGTTAAVPPGEFKSIYNFT